jgi:hypothetical protein
MQFVHHRGNNASCRGLKPIYVDRSHLQVLQRRDMGFHAVELAHHSLALYLENLSRRAQRHSLCPPV